jgi:hypothetical protein
VTTPYVEELALESKNNEGISEIITLTDKATGLPVDLTGMEFFSQARAGKNKDAALLCEISVTVYGDPTDGKLLFEVADTVMRNLDKVKGAYDVLVRSGAGIADNLYMAPFIVGTGVTDLDQWL